MTLDSLQNRLFEEGIFFTAKQPRFPRSTLHRILTNPFYVGRFKRRGREYPGKHEVLVPEPVFQRAQELLGGSTYRKHSLPYAGSLLSCSYCGAAITGEIKFKSTCAGIGSYDYYHCSRYTRDGHPSADSLRIRGTVLEQKLTEVVSRIRISSPEVRDWFQELLQRATMDDRQFRETHLQSLEVQHSRIQNRLEGLYKDKLDGVISAERFEKLNSTWCLEAQEMERQIATYNDASARYIDTGLKVFELSQVLPERFVTFDPAKKRELLEIICLNLGFDGASVIATYRKPFDILVEMPSIQSPRGGGI